MNNKPNILIIMVDQLNGTLFPDGPVDWLHVPNLKKLAQKSIRFGRSYTASPLCAPARAALMSGQLPSKTGVYDNASEFSASIPTYAHHLRIAGYQTSLSGKMHFVGPDQLHGFEERLTTDIYPADFGWTPDYRQPKKRVDWWYHNMSSVTDAGTGEISNQLEYDDEVTYHSCRKIYDLARNKDVRPWCLTVSFTHPHDPYVARKKYWDLYHNCAHLNPKISALSYEDQDPHSQRLLDASNWSSYDISNQMIQNARRAYFANVSYLDHKIGEIFDVLSNTEQEATIIFVSDHGDMLGERGLWFKMSFYDGSSRVPLMIASPKMDPIHINTPVSTMDLCPTLCDLAGISMEKVLPWTTGESLIPLMRGEARTNPAAMEYAAEGSYAPMVSLRYDKWKYNRCAIDPEQLFDLENDPNELVNMAKDPTHNKTLKALRYQSEIRWDLEDFDAQVRKSQAYRLVVYEAMRKGGYYPWDYQPLQEASERYMRNHMNLNTLESTQRFPK
jgi:choline-sulfatase